MTEKLVTDLKLAKQVARENIIKSTDLPQMTFRRLKTLNWLSEIIKGWYILKTPDADNGESTLWYSNFWSFFKFYLEENYKDNYCLNPLASIFLKTESNIIPDQVIVILKTGGARRIELPFKTSILFYVEKNNFPVELEEYRGLKIIELARAITMVPEQFFSNYETEAELSLLMIKSPGDITRYLLDKGLPVKADIIAGAYQFLNKDNFVEQITEDMKIIVHNVRPKNPFKKDTPSLNTSRIESPAVARIELMWKNFKKVLLEDKTIDFTPQNKKKMDVKSILEKVNSIYVHDAYNSLSIEGYSVTEELIQKIADGNFAPTIFNEDKNQEAALAAKGYYLAFSEVKKFIEENYGKKTNEIKYSKQIKNWYRQLFIPKVQSGLAQPSLLTSYRKKPVFIRGSRHTPVNKDFVEDVMDKFLLLLDEEDTPWIKALLGHFILVFIHPFPDGNGRTARFLMNAALVLSGHNWTVVQLQNKAEYFEVLEEASTKGNIIPYAKFIKKEMMTSAKWGVKI
jgi:prophage maintenance system killer protein